MKYRILKELGAYELQKEVNRFIESGWKPQGGIAVTTISTLASSEALLYLQAIIKE